MHVLVVEADPRRAAGLGDTLRSHGDVVDVAATAEDGEWLATEMVFDGVVIDRHLPDGDGIVLCADLRARGVWMPIVVVGNGASVDDCVAALDAGADDFIADGADGDELCARLRAVVRRGQPERPAVLQVGSLRLDPATGEVTARGSRLPVSGHALAILELLMRRQGRLVSREEIAAHAWDWAWEAHSNVVAVHIHEIRRLLRPIRGAPVVETVRGAGFRLVLPRHDPARPRRRTFPDSVGARRGGMAPRFTFF